MINPEITVKIKPAVYAQIQCHEKYEFSELPQLSVGNTTQVKLHYCPLPLNQTIRQYIKFMGVKHTKEFWYSNFKKELGVRLFRQHFQGMEAVEKLSISSGIENIEPDLFAEVPNVKWLILRCNLVRLPHNVFDNLSQLSVLELGANQITELAPGLFKNQRRLIHLNLWRNQFVNITKESFAGAESIEELDLSINLFETLSSDVFTLLPNLIILNLSLNRFITLPENLLVENRKLREFKFVNNQIPLQTLPDRLLSNLPQLKIATLNGNHFAYLPESLFRGSSELNQLDLSRNQLHMLPEMLFRDQINLQQLYLNQNDLEALPDRLFENTRNLETLNLSSNRLRKLSAHIFASLEKLKVLFLNNNNLHTIDRSSFGGLTSLTNLYMQNNFLSFNEINILLQEQELVTEGSPFQYLQSLSVLNLRNNSISRIFSDWNVNTLKLTELDLSYNRISMLSHHNVNFLSDNIVVNLTHNRITEVNLSEMESLILANRNAYPSKIKIYLNDNPLNCNCVILPFVQYGLGQMNRAVYESISLIADEMRCAEPENLYNLPVFKLNPRELVCPLDPSGTAIKYCPQRCSCFIRPVDRGVVVNCTGQELTEVPPLPVLTNFAYNFTELHIENNNISTLPTDNLTGYGYVAELYASNNSLTELVPENLPGALRVLDLTYNRLEGLNESFVEALNNTKSLASLMLAENNWSCDCDSTQLLNFVQQNHRRISDIARVKCDTGEKFDLITVNDLCSESLTLIITISIVISLLGLLIGLGTVLYFVYNMEIKVWLFTHNLCLWWVAEEELDKDKLYDAFISYSHKDEEFITEHLLPTLEKEPMNFKTCWHVRDFMPGELIPTQITKSVEDSRRTIVVLSNNFVQSVWGKMEFRTAHLSSMEEKRKRVIVIIYGDLGDIDQLDCELKAYLKMNTYVKWGDPWFWDKLRYAMPHPPTVKGLKGKGLIKNHLKSSVDDKLELIKPIPVTPPPQTTPPAEMNGGGHLNQPFTITNGKTAMNGNGFHPNGHHAMNGHANGHVNGAFVINSNAKQSDV